MISDLRYAFRTLMRTPAFTGIAILALALGIGANTAIFSVADALLIRPLPFHDPERLVMVWEDASHIGFAFNNLAPANYFDFLKQNTVFTDIAAFRGRPYNLTGGGTPELVIGRAVTPNFFSVLGVGPALGRAFTAAEDASGARVAVLGYGLWQRRFGGDPALVGREITINGANTTVVGIMPRGFQFPDKGVELWLPIQFTTAERNRRGSHFLTSVARLKPGVSLEQARAEMSTIAARLEREYPESNSRVGARVVPLREQMIGKTRIAVVVLLAASGCLLLIACSNIANLLLTRAIARRREIAIRTVLGAGTGRLTRQTITESLLLSFIGGGLGVVLANWSLLLLNQLIPTPVSGSLEAAIDARVLLFAIIISVATGIAFGVLPAISLSRTNLHDALKHGGRVFATRRSNLVRGALVVSEVALALTLLVGASLLLRTLEKLSGIELGFSPENILTMRTTLVPTRYDTDAKRIGFYEETLAKLKAIPGVQSASFSSNLPFTSAGNTMGFRIEGKPDPGNLNAQDVLVRVVTPGYFGTLGARLKAGREIEPNDSQTAPLVVVINETFANQYWGGENPIGRRMRFTSGPDAPWRTVVGVVADIRERGLELTPKPVLYAPMAQNSEWFPSFIALKTSVPAATVAGAARQAIWATDSEQPVFGIRTMEEIVDVDMRDRRRQMWILAVFAGLAMLLAAVGIYGVLSYSVTQQTREIGLRVALGATTSSVTRMVLSHGLRLTALGLVIGAATSLALGRAMTGLLYGITPTDPAAFASVSVTLLCVAAAACAIPAWRAARLDPITALRDE